MLRVQCTPLIGLPQFDGWSQVVHTPSHQFVAAFAVVGQNAGNVGRDLLDQLAAAQPQTAADLHTIITSSLQYIRDKGCQLHIAAALVGATKTTLVACHGAVLLRRAQKVGIVLRSLGELQLVEGSTDRNDVIVLATQQAASFLGEIQQKIEQGYDVDTIITTLVPIVHGASNSALSALAFVDHRALVSQVEEEAAEPAVTLEISTGLDELALSIETNSPGSELPELPEPSAAVPETTNDEPELPNVLAPAHQPAGAKKQYPPAAIFRKISHGLITGSLRLATQTARLGGQAWEKFKSPRATYLTDATTTKKWWKRLRILAGGAALVALVGAGGWWYQLRQLAQAQAQVYVFQQELQAAQGQFTTDPVASREKVASVITAMEEMKKKFHPQLQWVAANYAQKELTAVTATYQEISGREEFKELPTFFDFSLVQTDFVAQDSAQIGTQAFFLDRDRRQLIQLDLQKKSASLTKIGEMKLVDMATNDTAVWLLGEGVWEWAPTSSAAAQLRREAGDSNREATLLGAFGPYVYVVNPAKRSLYRYLDEKDKLSEPVGWLVAAQNVEFKELTSISIDGEVWLGTQKGEIKRFASGKEVAFTPRGMSQALSGPVMVYTHESLSEIYVLESAKRRVVVLAKNDGTLLKEISSPSLAAATSLLVIPEQKKILAISGSLVFEIQP